MKPFLILFATLMLFGCSNSTVSKEPHKTSEGEDDVTLVSLEKPQDILPDDWTFKGEGYVFAFNTNPAGDDFWLAEVDMFWEALDERGIVFKEVYGDFTKVPYGKNETLDISEIVNMHGKGYLLFIPPNGITLHKSEQMGFYSLIQQFFVD